jgi:hypothetical protein
MRRELIRRYYGGIPQSKCSFSRFTDSPIQWRWRSELSCRNIIPLAEIQCGFQQIAVQSRIGRDFVNSPPSVVAQLPAWMWMRGGAGRELMAHGVIFVDYNQQGGR